MQATAIQDSYYYFWNNLVSQQSILIIEIINQLGKQIIFSKNKSYRMCTDLSGQASFQKSYVFLLFGEGAYQKNYHYGEYHQKNRLIVIDSFCSIAQFNLFFYLNQTDCRYILNNNQMQGKICAITLIILGVYILSSVLLGRSSKNDEHKSAELYHIGCYDIERPLSHSKDIKQYLFKLNEQFNQTSPSRIVALNSQIQRSVFSETGGNELARSFQKYIASYQNIKSRNQYQQAFFNTLKQTKDQFLQCREKFNQQPWNCRNVSKLYNQTEDLFNSLKFKMKNLMIERAQHLNKTEELLKDEDVTKDAEYTEKYTKEIDIMNQMIAKKHQKIKHNNETFIKLINEIFKVQTEINQTKKLLNQCSKNKHEIDFCKNISDYVMGLYDEVNLKEIERSMKQKRIIIDLLKSHLIQSKKLGEDITLVEEQLEEAQRQLEQEQILYHETNNTGKCGLELQFRCSHDNIEGLQKNLTLLNQVIIRLLEEKQTLNTKLNKDIYEKNQFQSNINRLRQELKNNAVDIDHLKLKEEKKKKQLQQYRNTLTEIIIKITDASKEIAFASFKRSEQNKKIDELMERGEELIECLSKKELYLKLDSKKPKNTEQDEILMKEASQSLTGVIKKLLKQ